MKKILYFLAIFVLFFSCSKDDEQVGRANLNLKIAVNYDGDPLVLGEELDYDDSTKIYFTRFSFFVSHLSIIKGNDIITLIDTNSVEYWDVGSAHIVPGPQQAYERTFQNIESGDYDLVRITIGLPENINSQSPSDFSNSSPLSDFAEYWEAWESYVFLKVEGKADTDGDGDFDLPLAFHIGGDQAYRPLESIFKLNMPNGSTGALTINIDLKQMFERENGMYDLRAVPRTHSVDVLSSALDLLDNLLTGFTTQF